jgi:23S rRNA (cytosine1962-C5)-methyltransferase
LLHDKTAALELAKDERAFRWVFSENDFVPGLVVDIFNQEIVAQLNSAPVEIFWYSIRKVLIQAYSEFYGETPTVIELRNAQVRKKEGLELILNEATTNDGEPELLVNWNGLKWQMNPGQQQKTGMYFDQRENHKMAKSFAQKFHYTSAWDLYCYQGGFSLHLLSAGLQVTAIDSSAQAIETLRNNVPLNNLSPTLIRTEISDVETWLHQAVTKGEKVDLIILDPPSLVRSRQDIASALKLFTNLNALAMSCLKPGGMLVSSVCSHHLTPKIITPALKLAAEKVGRSFDLVSQCGPSLDHPILKEFPEGNYLHAHFLKFQ